MNEKELREFLEARTSSPHVARLDTGPYETLPCVGCAHSAAGSAFPGHPSGERPCMSCVRNPHREEWAAKRDPAKPVFLIGSDGLARTFDALEGTMYNGAPRLYHPMDNYVTLDQRDQEDWLERNPGYRSAVNVRGDVVTPLEKP